MTYETTPDIEDRIDVPRLRIELALSDAVLEGIAALDIPTCERVPSTSPIKTGTVADALRITSALAGFGIIGVKVPSGVPEQPLGQQAIDGCLNRLERGIAKRETIAPGEADRVAWFSIENGLFRTVGRGSLVAAVDRRADNIVQLLGDADMSTEFDPDADYADRAVAAVKLPGRPTVVCISPEQEAVTFPREAVRAAHDTAGGFAQNTAGAWLADRGIVSDKQNPHRDLTRNREGGALPREDQMARVLLRGLVWLSEHNEQLP